MILKMIDSGCFTCKFDNLYYFRHLKFIHNLTYFVEKYLDVLSINRCSLPYLVGSVLRIGNSRFCFNNIVSLFLTSHPIWAQARGNE